MISDRDMLEVYAAGKKVLPNCNLSIAIAMFVPGISFAQECIMKGKNLPIEHWTVDDLLEELAREMPSVNKIIEYRNASCK